ncbi:uncharacterized protein DDB_G0273701/DDB_G0273221-like [Carica papaya]|uniref:uncharacterized protein DDB_G0273701/DDB_G0273221-like n=1 Tax=Carica papaya TaxID=3649 RepID=UPI000B8CCDD4|nr:uncharacterized protein DDB_G0273701/DDB_G0273221-like [Carica papaya]
MAIRMSNKTTAMLLNLSFLLSLILIASMAESRLFSFGGFLKPTDKSPECDQVFGARSGDTCFGISQMFNLTQDSFDAINPNLDCDKLFVGQWLCVSGSAN